MDTELQTLISSDSFRTLALISLATLPLKGLALWKAAGRKRVAWYIALLLTNTLGILDTIYYFFIDLDEKKTAHKTN